MIPARVTFSRSSRRLGSGKVAQWQVLYLGEINDSQQAAWTKSFAVYAQDVSSTQVAVGAFS